MSTTEVLPKTPVVVLFDLDRTMMKTGEFTDATMEHFDTLYAAPEKVVPGTFNAWTKQYIREVGGRTNYDPVTLTQFWYAQLTKLELGDTTSPDQLHTEFKKFIELEAARFLYEDTLASIDEILALGAIPALFSQGVLAWQELKFAHAQLAARFANKELWFISPDKTSAEYIAHIRSVLAGAQLSGAKVLLVDDSPAILNALHAHWPEVELFLVTRKGQEGTYPEQKLEVPATSVADFSLVKQRIIELLGGASSAAE